ncbi:class I SAM-dependent methyltransferase [Tautonia marina]|uniref:class I SAM-dependent methyltransferase n=1 Tax=Tautonia marina TaxID=2653855 RepID=UPI0012607C23|nr:class I SAM-dependent methyltransferase [Tautonia marina]
MTASEFSKTAAALYASTTGFRRQMAVYRPYICPFERVAECVDPGSRVLDVGCGQGMLLALLGVSGRCSEGVGFDSDADAIAVAREMATHYEAQGHPGALRFEHLPVSAAWPEGRFDVVTIVDVMHHVPRDQRPSVLQLAFEALRPGGRLIYKDIGHRPRWRALANNCHDLLVAREWVRYTPITQVRLWAGELGFASSDPQRINRLWYAHDLAVFTKPGPDAVRGPLMARSA